MTHVRHDGDVAVPKRMAQEHRVVQEGGGAEATLFGGEGGKGGDLKGVQILWVHTRDGHVFQINGKIHISERL